MTMPDELDLRELSGCIATCVTTGFVDPAYSACMTEMRAWNIEHGFTRVEYRLQEATLVEAGRDAVCAHALKHGYDWLLQIDADATFPPNTLARLLEDAYVLVPDADAVGAYSQLKGFPHWPTIDTGTGTWEEHYPGEGILPAIRTGAHCILVKTSALRRFGPPWFRTRLTKRPAVAFAEVDNFARIHSHGANPLTRDPEWSRLLDLAKAESHVEPSTVGEDSGFSDALLAAGGTLYVDTDLVTGHVMRKTITPADLRDALRERDRMKRLVCGVLE